MAVALPVELFIDDHALWRPDDTVRRRQKVASQSAGVRINQPRFAVKSLAELRGIRPISLKMVERAGFEVWNENAPNIAPAVSIPVEGDDFIGLTIAHFFVQQDAHRGRRSAEDHELHAVVVENRTVRQGMSELER